MARPRGFDEDDVLDKALHIFWRDGFDGASISDLVEAMGVCKPSLYMAFGSKECLFRLAVTRYRRDYLGFRHEALERETPRSIVEGLLEGMALLHTGGATPPGCFETNNSIRCSRAGEAIRSDLIGERSAFVEQLCERFEATKSGASLPAGVGSADAALFVVTLIMGMAMEARAGASRDDLLLVARVALTAWPA